MTQKKKKKSAAGMKDRQRNGSICIRVRGNPSREATPYPGVPCSETAVPVVRYKPKYFPPVTKNTIEIYRLYIYINQSKKKYE
jgi:hypothetical protein